MMKKMRTRLGRVKEAGAARFVGEVIVPVLRKGMAVRLEDPSDDDDVGNDDEFERYMEL